MSTVKPTPPHANGAGYSGASARPRYAQIVGWGMAVPERVVTNEDLARMVETSDEWIRSRTGIRERRMAVSPKESTLTLAIQAAREALKVADVPPSALPPRPVWYKMRWVRPKRGRSTSTQPAPASSTPCPWHAGWCWPATRTTCWWLAQRR